jgi:DNA-binding PadR family transcriptional regulator
MPRKKCLSNSGKGWWLSSVILLLIAEKSCHGYELVEKLKEFEIDLQGVGNIARVYTFLNMFEDSQYVKADWDTSFSPPRKVYAITSKGIEQLSVIKSEMFAQKNLVELYIERFSDLEKNNSHGKKL